MERITSFSVDHRKLTKGVYVSRIDGNLITYDIRMTQPNVEPALKPEAAHTIEHIGATLLRNGKYKDQVIYFGPMGCRTGFYLLIRGDYAPMDIIPLLERAFDYASDFNGDIPGCTTIECGNCYDMDLPEAINDAADYYNLLIAPKKYNLEYPPITEEEKEKARKKYEKEKKQQLKILKEMRRELENSNEDNSEETEDVDS